VAGVAAYSAASALAATVQIKRILVSYLPLRSTPAALPRVFATRAHVGTIQRFWRGHRGRLRFAAAREAKDRELRLVGGGAESAVPDERNTN
jgi:hypothetical protein